MVRTSERRTVPGDTEFERLLAAFTAVWPQISPASLDDGQREPDFVAREIDEPRERIDALVGAFRLQEGLFDGVVPAAILYGLARGEARLGDIARLALATSSQLKNAILQAIEQRIIPAQEDGVIERSIRIIREMTVAQALVTPPAAGGAAYSDVLRKALPDEAQQTALLRAAAGREADPPALWAALRAHPAFAEAGAVDRAQFALQLDAVTLGHLPLMEALQQDHGITTMRGLLDIGADGLRATVVRPGIGVPDGMPGANDVERADAYVAGVVDQLQQAFPTETVAKVLASAPAGAVGDEAVHAATVAALSRATSDAMRTAGAALDIRTTHIDTFLADHADAVLVDVAEEARPKVVSAIKRTQRLFRISTGAEAFDWMVRNDVQSAFQIAEIPLETFVRGASPTLGEAQARILHGRASAAGSASLMAYVQINDALVGAYPLAVLGGDDRIVAAKAVNAAVAKHMPSWHALFNENAICACVHCRSAYSPAAYLVDVLNFLDRSTKTAAGKTPLDMLLARRPDIAQLKLTCENTNTTIPYVDLVNEVLESLVVSLDPLKIPAFDTEGASAQEQRAAPQHTNWDAYLTPSAPGAAPRLDRAVYPRSLPFDGPLAAARSYLQHLGVARADLMAAFAGGPLTNALAAERVGLGPGMFEVISGEALDGAPAELGVSLDERYGWAGASLVLQAGDSGPVLWMLKQKLVVAGAVLAVGADPASEPFDPKVPSAVAAFQTKQGLPATGALDAATWEALTPSGSPFVAEVLSHVPTFLTRSGLSFHELLAVLKTRFINPEWHTLEIARVLELPGTELLAFVQGGFQTPAAALVDALKGAGVTEADFTVWAQARFDGGGGARLRQTMLMDGPVAAGCDLNVLTLRHWDAAAPALTGADWLKLDRFIRLWRALDWSIEDLDLALASLGATDIDAAVLRQLAQISELARQLDLTVAQVTALWADPDPTQPKSLYGQRFRNRALLQLDPTFQPDWAGEVLKGATIAEHLSALHAGLHVSGADLTALRDYLGLANDAAALTLASLGSLLRFVTLARALQLNVRDLIRMLDLSGLQPFVQPTDDWAALHFVHDVRRLQRSGVTPALLELVLGDVTTPGRDESRARLLAQIGDGLRAIAKDLDATAETDGTLTRRALTLLGVEAGLVDAAMPVLLGTDRNAAVLPAPAAPAPAIPAEWAERLAYGASPASPSLACLGALTDAEQATLLGFSTDAGFRAAVARLAAAPRKVLQDLASALTKLGVQPPPANQLLATSLFVTTPETRERLLRERLAVLLDKVLPILRERLSAALVKQMLAALQPDAETLALLLEGKRSTGRPLMPASDLSRLLIADFTDLVSDIDTTAAAQGYELLSRLRRLFETLSLGADDAATAMQHLVALRPSAGRLCGYADWAALASYASLNRRAGQPANALAKVLSADSLESARAALACATGWAEETIIELMQPTGLGFGLTEVQQIEPLKRLITAGELVVALRVTVQQAAAWARQPIGQAGADAARRAVKARYDEPPWLEVAAALSDPLRAARRAALVAFLLPRIGLPDGNALYQRLLIDVEMSPCMDTSRIKQAISSAQLFVQRCLLNLEPAVPPASIDAQHWSWMQNYRVWEANRKVLFYPENWIVPELRDDKTPFFRELESDLLQNDVNSANVERALGAYLGKLDEVAKLEIVALHVQDEFEPGEKLRTVVHIFGRTANQPYAHYYRRYVVTHNGTALWTPWESMPVDVQGTLIAPVVFNRRLYVFWATVTPKEQGFQEFGISWSEYRDAAWSPTHVLEAGQAFTLPFQPAKASHETIQGVPQPTGHIERLEARVEDDQLMLQCIVGREFLRTVPNAVDVFGGLDATNAGASNFNGAYALAVETFVLSNCQAKLIKERETENNLIWSAGVVLRLRNNTLKARPLSRRSPSPAPDGVLGKIRYRSRIVEGTWIHDGNSYFVFEDDRQAFLAEVTPTRSRMIDKLSVPDLAFPHRAAAQTGAAAFLSTTTQSRQSANLTRVEVARQPWASAGLALANIGVASLASSASAIFRADAERPSLHDSVTAHAITAEIVAKQLALERPAVNVRFEPLFHPFVCSYIKALQQFGVPGVLTLGNQQLQLKPDFAVRYQPDTRVVLAPHPTSAVDFGATVKAGVYRSTAYSVYNWELFFHLPMMVADRLMQNRRFEDARQWLHFVFNPTDGSGGYWKVVPFQATVAQNVEQWLQQLNAGDADLQQQVAEWKDHPFEPHRIARMRLPAYKKFVVMKYLDNLIAWGDSLFERDTLESINAATQLYVMAADLLGPRMAQIPPRGEPTPMTFADMRNKLDALSNAAAEFENAVPFMSGTTTAPSSATVGLLGVSRSLYFCLPPNDKLLAYWDTVADRLFKVRHCMNLAGVVRQLPLFEPEIDPALLVAATAQGLNIGSVLSELGAPLPHQRFRFTLQRALDACSNVTALGAALLSTLEKKDAEDLAQLRASQDATLRRLMRETRKQQEMEALEQVEGLKRSRAAPVERLRHFRGLMGLDAPVPDPGAEVPIVAYDPKPSAEGGVFLIDEERQELDSSHSARDWQVISATTDILASLAHYIPTLEIPTSPVTKMLFGGEHIGPGLAAISRYQTMLGSKDSYDASHAGKMGSYKRRHQDYAHQANVAAREIMSVDKQITAATIRAAVAGLERKHLETEIEHAELVEQHYRSKYTNKQLYGWMHGQITSLYYQSFKLALDLAKGAERCCRFERGPTSTASNIIRSGGWDNMRAGLLAGETLQLQLRQLERAHQEQDRRELEITKHVSLCQLAPLALLRLKQTGRCEVELPELLFDMDYPGHYMRRVKSVSVSIPAVTGPYTSLNATLTMLTNQTRIKAELRGGNYERDLENEDNRFVTDFTPIQAIVTSSGQNDSGLFELSLSDERYLPFEGGGAASLWSVEIDQDCNRFDLQTVADVVLHLRYTARDGGQMLAKTAKKHWMDIVKDAASGPLARLFSLKHEFPTEWQRFRTMAEVNGEHVRSIAITRDRFPMLFGGCKVHIGRVDLFGVPMPGKTPTKLPALRLPDGTMAPLASGVPLGQLVHRSASVDVNTNDGEAASEWRLSVAPADVGDSIDQLDDLLLVCHYDVRPAKR
ncbi:MAG: neuraminidase-like domain-containing protein [Pseudomonadota bacterium]